MKGRELQLVLNKHSVTAPRLRRSHEGLDSDLKHSRSCCYLTLMRCNVFRTAAAKQT